MRPFSRAIVPALLAAVLALAGCQTHPGTSTAKQPAPGQTTPAIAVLPVEIYVAYAQASAGLIPVEVPDGVLYLQAKPILSRADLTEAAALTDGQGRHCVGLRLNPAGTQKLDAASRVNVGNMLALVVGRELVAAPLITQPLAGGIVAFAVPSAAVAAELAARIRGDAR